MQPWLQSWDRQLPAPLNWCLSVIVWKSTAVFTWNMLHRGNKVWSIASLSLKYVCESSVAISLWPKLICFHFYLLVSPCFSTQHVIFIRTDQLLSILTFFCFSQTGSAPLQREWFMPSEMNEWGAISLPLGTAIGSAVLFWSDVLIHFEQHTWLLLSRFPCRNRSSRRTYLQLWWL